jgi:hypothetical protein
MEWGEGGRGHRVRVRVKVRAENGGRTCIGRSRTPAMVTARHATPNRSESIRAARGAPTLAPAAGSCTVAKRRWMGRTCDGGGMVVVVVWWWWWYGGGGGIRYTVHGTVVVVVVWWWCGVRWWHGGGGARWCMVVWLGVSPQHTVARS